jgi:hypothetical protein
MQSKDASRAASISSACVIPTLNGASIRRARPRSGLEAKPSIFECSWLCSLFAVRAAPLKVKEPRLNCRGFESGVRYIIAMLPWSIARVEAIDRDKWIAQTLTSQCAPWRPSLGLKTKERSARPARLWSFKVPS